MKQYIKFILGVCLCSTGQVTGQFLVEAQLRNRFEFRDGYQQLLPGTANPSFLVTQRTRLNLSWQNEKLKFRFTPQDVRIWGDEDLASTTGVFGNFASLDLFEGFAEIQAAEQCWISLGRQQLVYDNQRLLASRNWNQNGIAYDAVVVKFNRNKWNLHLGGSWNTLYEIRSENRYPSSRNKTLNFFWLNRQINDHFKASMMNVFSGVTKTDSTNTLYFKHTTGIYSIYKDEVFNLQGEFYYQHGKNKSGQDVSAFLGGLDVNFTAPKFTPGMGFVYLSGNSKTGDELKTDHLFDIFYGARHRYYGSMDYFRNMPSHTSQGGLADFYLYLNWKINKKLSLQDMPHYFRLAQTNPLTSTNADLGFENDIVLKYKFNKWGTLEAGYLFLLPTSTLQKIQKVPGTDFAQFAYLQLTLTPVLFEQNQSH